MLDSAMNPPSLVVNLTFAAPVVTPVTFPDESTVATTALSTVHLPVLSVAFAGATDGISASVAPTLRLNSVLFRVTPVTLFLRPPSKLQRST